MKNLRTFIEQVARNHPEDVVEVHREVDPKFEIAAIQKKLARHGHHPLLIFRNVKGHDMPVVVNVYATRARMALALDTDEANLPHAYREAETHPIPPVMTDDAPVQEVVYAGDQVDLTKLPVCQCHEPDAGPYLTAGLVIVRHPDSDAHNVSFGRLQLVDRNTVYTHITPGRHLHQLFRMAEAEGKPLDVAVCLGNHPAWALAGTSLVPFGEDELWVAGGLLKEPVRLTRCRVLDADALADCEIVLEGQIMPGERALEGPFCEFPGYSTGAREREVLKVRAITMRRDAYYQHITASTNDHRLLGAVGKESRLFKTAQAAAPTVKAVHMPLSGCGRFHCYVSMEKTAKGQARNVAMAILAADIYCKLVVVVDEDIDVYNEQEVLWAIATRVQGDRDIIVIPGALGSDLDPSAPEDGVSCKTIIDATAKPLLKDYNPRATIPADVWEAVDIHEFLPRGSRQPVAP